MRTDEQCPDCGEKYIYKVLTKLDIDEEMDDYVYETEFHCICGRSWAGKNGCGRRYC